MLRGKFCGSTTVGERGQIVIPAEARKEYGVEVGDKLMVFMHPHHDGLFLVKAETVTKLVTDAMTRLGKIIQESDGDDEPRGGVRRDSGR
ncbi:MAG TPA: AbrB/MazE/SpoVT family DNA-binding domain-containing protein [Firmicutes bacterium]|nr:AbrB/MazE/SpoVT family DNA-binding domain-containing protein [Bacillota bacterium]HHY98526.1 AbrB/MazE/SpoVT family DNA-binding domain-containing protein [Bacillota bacterium]